MTVVSLPTPKRDTDCIFVCACTCASFELRGDGVPVCRNCRAEIDTGDGRQWVKIKPGDAMYEGPVSYSDGGNDSDFAEAKTKRDAKAADWMIFGDVQGKVRSWCREFIETPEQEKWLRDGVGAGLDAILGDKR